MYLYVCVCQSVNGECVNHECIYGFMNVCIMYMYICMYIRVCVYVCVWTYIHNYIHRYGQYALTIQCVLFKISILVMNITS